MGDGFSQPWPPNQPPRNQRPQQQPGQIKIFNPNLFGNPQPQQAYNNVSAAAAAASNGYDPSAGNNSQSWEQKWSWGDENSNGLTNNSQSWEQLWSWGDENSSGLTNDYGYSNNSNPGYENTNTNVSLNDSNTVNTIKLNNRQPAQQWQQPNLVVLPNGNESESFGVDQQQPERQEPVKPQGTYSAASSTNVEKEQPSTDNVADTSIGQSDKLEPVSQPADLEGNVHFVIGSSPSSASASVSSHSPTISQGDLSQEQGPIQQIQDQESSRMGRVGGSDPMPPSGEANVHPQQPLMVPHEMNSTGTGCAAAQIQPAVAHLQIPIDVLQAHTEVGAAATQQQNIHHTNVFGNEVQAASAGNPHHFHQPNINESLSLNTSSTTPGDAQATHGTELFQHQDLPPQVSSAFHPTTQPHQQPEVAHPPMMPHQQPEVAHPPMLEHQQPEVAHPPMMEHQQPEVAHPPMLEHQQPEVADPPMMAHQQPEVADPPMMPHQQPEVADPPMMAYQQPEVDQPPMMTNQQPEVADPPMMAHQQPEVADPPMMPHQQPEVADPPMMAYQQPEVDQPPMMTNQQPEVADPPMMAHQQPEVADPPMMAYQQPEVANPPMMPHQQTEVDHPPMMAHQQTEVPHTGITNRVPHLPMATPPQLLQHTDMSHPPTQVHHHALETPQHVDGSIHPAIALYPNTEVNHHPPIANASGSNQVYSVSQSDNMYNSGFSANVQSAMPNTSAMSMHSPGSLNLDHSSSVPQTMVPNISDSFIINTSGSFETHSSASTVVSDSVPNTSGFFTAYPPSLSSTAPSAAVTGVTLFSTDGSMDSAPVQQPTMTTAGLFSDRTNSAGIPSGLQSNTKPDFENATSNSSLVTLFSTDGSMDSAPVQQPTMTTAGLFSMDSAPVQQPTRTTAGLFSMDSAPVQQPTMTTAGLFSMDSAPVQQPTMTTAGLFSMDSAPVQQPTRTTAGLFSMDSAPVQQPTMTTAGLFSMDSAPVQQPTMTTAGLFSMDSAPVQQPTRTTAGLFSMDSAPVQQPTRTTAGLFSMDSAPVQQPTMTTAGLFSMDSAPVQQPTRTTAGLFSMDSAPVQQPTRTTAGLFSMDSAPVQQPTMTTAGLFSMDSAPVQQPTRTTAGLFSMDSAPVQQPTMTTAGLFSMDSAPVQQPTMTTAGLFSDSTHSAGIPSGLQSNTKPDFEKQQHVSSDNRLNISTAMGLSQKVVPRKEVQVLTTAGLFSDRTNSAGIPSGLQSNTKPDFEKQQHVSSDNRPNISTAMGLSQEVVPRKEVQVPDSTEEKKSALSPVSSGIAGITPPVSSGIAGITPPVSSGIAGITPPVSSGIAGITPPVSSGIAGITPPVSSGIAGITPPVSSGIAGITPPVSSGNAGITPPVSSGIAGITPPVSSGIAGITPPVSSGNAGITPPVSSGIAGITPPVSSGIAGITPPVSSGIAGITPPVSSGIAGITPPVSSGIAGITPLKSEGLSAHPNTEQISYNNQYNNPISPGSSVGSSTLDNQTVASSPENLFGGGGSSIGNPQNVPMQTPAKVQETPPSNPGPFSGNVNPDLHGENKAALSGIHKAAVGQSGITGIPPQYTQSDASACSQTGNRGFTPYQGTPSVVALHTDPGHKPTLPESNTGMNNRQGMHPSNNDKPTLPESNTGMNNSQDMHPSNNVTASINSQPTPNSGSVKNEANPYVTHSDPVLRQDTQQHGHDNRSQQQHPPGQSVDFEQNRSHLSERDQQDSHRNERRTREYDRNDSRYRREHSRARGRKHSRDRRREHSRDRRREHSRDRRREHSRDRRREHSRDRRREHSRDRRREHSRDRRREHSRDRGREHSRDRRRKHSRDRGREHSRDRGREHSRDRRREHSRDRRREHSRDRGREHSRDRGDYYSNDPRRNDRHSSREPYSREYDDRYGDRRYDPRVDPYRDPYYDQRYDPHRGHYDTDYYGRSRQGYPEDPHRPHSRQGYYDYDYRQDRYERGYEEEMRGMYQQYPYHQQYDYNQHSSSGYYDQYGNYHRSQSYDSNYSYDRNSNNSQSRGSTPGFDNQPGDQFARDFNTSRPGSRQSGYQQSPIYSVDNSKHYYDSYDQSYLASQQASHTQPPVPEPEPARRTPPRHTLPPHMKASILPGGVLVEVQPNRPQDGQPATVVLRELPEVNDGTCIELKSFPGPLSRNETHKADVLRFCQSKVQELSVVVGMIDRESAQLMWKYLELLIKQNGIVVGTDVADLLMEGHEQSAQNMPISGVSAGPDSSVLANECGDLQVRVTSNRSLVSQPSGAALDRFRRLCLFGRKKEALEFAMKSNLWEQALFLAMRMGPGISASVTTRFMNSALSVSDPLRTLYQMLSGRQPAACTMVGDERFGDWRPHLAVILSQATERSELDKKSIIAMGDAFATKGLLFASQFCYLMANCHFQDSSKKTAKLVLLGTNHTLPLEQHATNVAIQMTEVFEYGMSLAKPNFCIPSFQKYKFMYMTRLVDSGLPEEALRYCEVLSNTILQSPSSYTKTLVQNVVEFGDRLKEHDPQRLETDEALPDPVWLQSVQAVSRQYESGALQFVPTSGSQTPATANTPSISDVGEQMGNLNIGGQESLSQIQPPLHDASQQQYTTMQQQQLDSTQQHQIPVWDPNSNTWVTTDAQGQQPTYKYINDQWVPVTQDGNVNTQQTDVTPEQQQQECNKQPQAVEESTMAAELPSSNILQPVQQSVHYGHTEQNSAFDFYGHATQSSASASTLIAPVNSHVAKPLMNGTVNKTSESDSETDSDDVESTASSTSTVNDVSQHAPSTYYTPLQPSDPSTPLGAATASNEEDVEEKPKKKTYWPGEDDEDNDKIMAAAKKVSGEKGKEGGKGLFGWKWPFGKSKQSSIEMKLPDDKKPSIVWDEQKKAWIDLDRQGEEDQTDNSAPLPPKDSELTAAMNGASVPTPPPSGAPTLTPNRYSRGQLKGGRKGYVDILAGSSKSASTAPVLSHMPKSQSVPSNMFIPSVAESAVTPAPTDNAQQQQQAAVNPQETDTCKEYYNQQPPPSGADPAVTAQPQMYGQQEVPSGQSEQQAEGPVAPPPQTIQFFNPANFQQPKELVAPIW